jgi:phospholipid-binding lipoprotein MlaA
MNTKSVVRLPIALLGVLVLLSQGGCASLPGADPRDPLEPINRTVYRFNDVVDRAFLKPVATAYNQYAPKPVRDGVTNFFSNVSDVWSFTNNVAQLKPNESAETFMRVSVNTVLGLGGVLDIASEIGLEQHKEDFGQTLGYWGVPPGPYLVLPVLGPSTVRDVVGLRVDSLGNVIYDVDPIRVRNQVLVMNAVDTRASYLRAGQVLEEAALDPYSFIRDVYLQKRRNDIHDGQPPADEEDVTPAADTAAAPQPRAAASAP